MDQSVSAPLPATPTTSVPVVHGKLTAHLLPGVPAFTDPSVPTEDDGHHLHTDAQVSPHTPTPEHLALKALLQRAFDKTWVHLNKQQVAAANGDGCYYRRPNGHSCAVGCHIPDNVDFSAFEFTSISEVESYRRLFDEPIVDKYVAKAKALYVAMKLGGLDPDNATLMDLLSKMQRAHDNVLQMYGLPDWRERMDEIANEIGLETRAIDFVPDAVSK